MGEKCEDPHSTTKSRWGEKCEDPHMPLGVESTTKSRWGEKCEDPHIPLGAESTCYNYDGGDFYTSEDPVTQVLKVDRSHYGRHWHWKMHWKMENCCTFNIYDDDDIYI